MADGAYCQEYHPSVVANHLRLPATQEGIEEEELLDTHV